MSDAERVHHSLATRVFRVSMMGSIALGVVTLVIGLALYTTMLTGQYIGQAVGGDFYDFFLIDQDHLCLVVADVSDKGMPAALFSMIAKTMLKMQAQQWGDPKQLLSAVNAALSKDNEDGIFVTAWLGILEISTGELIWSDAGHERMLLARNGVWSFLPKEGGMAIAAVPSDILAEIGADYQNQTIHLNPGDAIFQYTDGVTEATNANEELFGEERLLSAMNSAPSCNPRPAIRQSFWRISAGRLTGLPERWSNLTTSP